MSSGWSELLNTTAGKVFRVSWLRNQVRTSKPSPLGILRSRRINCGSGWASRLAKWLCPARYSIASSPLETRRRSIWILALLKARSRKRKSFSSSSATSSVGTGFFMAWREKRRPRLESNNEESKQQTLSEKKGKKDRL